MAHWNADKISTKNAPNSPCMCGSGRKQKKCHPFGAPIYGPIPEPPPPHHETHGIGLGMVCTLATMLVLGSTGARK